MDSGQWALIAVAGVTLIGTIYGIRNTRKSTSEQTDVAADANEISEFEANIRAFDLRAKNAEESYTRLERRFDVLEQKYEALQTAHEKESLLRKRQAREMVGHITALEALIPNPPGPPIRPTW